MRLERLIAMAEQFAIDLQSTPNLPAETLSLAEEVVADLHEWRRFMHEAMILTPFEGLFSISK